MEGGEGEGEPTLPHGRPADALVRVRVRIGVRVRVRG